MIFFQHLPSAAVAALVLWGAGLATAHAQGAAPLQVLPAQSEIIFTTRQMGVPVDGSFTRFTAQVTLDPRQPAAGRVLLSIDTGSARFGSAELDAEVPKPTWLNTAKFPQATFTSSAIKAAGPGRFEITGQLAIKGSSRVLVVPVSLTQAANGTGTASGSFTLQRLDFKIGEGEWSDTSLLVDAVEVRFKLALSGLPR